MNERFIYDGVQYIIEDKKFSQKNEVINYAK